MKKLFVVFAFTLFSFNAGAADGVPACTSKNVGNLQCMAGRMCECKFMRASAMAGTPDRFSWDCGINQGACLDNGAGVTAPQAPYNGPASVGYGVSTSNTTLNNSPSTSLGQSTSTTQQQQSPTVTNTQTQTPTQTQTQTGTQSNTQTQTGGGNQTVNP